MPRTHLRSEYPRILRENLISQVKVQRWSSTLRGNQVQQLFCFYLDLRARYISSFGTHGNAIPFQSDVSPFGGDDGRNDELLWMEGTKQWNNSLDCLMGWDARRRIRNPRLVLSHRSSQSCLCHQLSCCYSFMICRWLSENTRRQSGYGVQF